MSGGARFVPSESGMAARDVVAGQLDRAGWVAPDHPLAGIIPGKRGRLLPPRK